MRDDLYNLGPRQRLWKAQLVMFREHPLIGVGWNNNERKAKEVVDRLYPEQRENFYGHAHSVPLQILSTTGLLGFAAFVWIWVEIFRAASQVLAQRSRDQIEHWLARGLIVGFVGFNIQGLTQWNFGDAEVLHNVVFFWAVIAALQTSSPAGVAEGAPEHSK
jgi:O-antigen ligase